MSELNARAYFLIKLGLQVAGLATVVFCFQNCSPFKAQPLGAGSTSNSSNGSGGTTTPPASGMKDVFMAAGHVGRTVMSCDDGVTWINNRSDNEATRCWGPASDPNSLECDHTPTSSHGLDAGDGWFFTNYGWGYNGSVRRSRDGINWETLRSDGWGGGVAYAKSVLLLDWYTAWLSLDQGTTWTADTTLPAMDHSHLTRLGDRFYLSSGTGTGLAYSDDQGQTWTVPSTFQPYYGWFFAQGNGVIVAIGMQTVSGNIANAWVARSTDNGATWTGQQLWNAAGHDWGALLFNGQQFMAWGNGALWTSIDGQNWQSTPLPVGGPLTVSGSPGPVAFNPKTGTYVTIPGDYTYENQMAYRSVDGVNWSAVGSDHFVGSHPIRSLIVGQMEAKYCP